MAEEPRGSRRKLTRVEIAYARQRRIDLERRLLADMTKGREEAPSPRPEPGPGPRQGRHRQEDMDPGGAYEFSQ